MEEDPAITDYLATCKSYGILPSTDVLNRIQLGSDDYVITPLGVERFGNLELRAFARLLDFADSERLQCLSALDVSRCTLGPSSALLIADLLRRPQCCIEFLDVSYQDIGPEGARAIASSLQASRSVSKLFMHGCGLGDIGGRALADMMRNSSKGRFKVIDLQNNFISAPICSELQALADERGIRLRLEGNRVTDEVWNAVTHCLGEFLVICGTAALLMQLGKRPAYCRAPIIIYCASLNTLYISSTLFHAFFALGDTTVYIFSILDYSGIFVLIAGTYSPMLGILFHGEPWARNLLITMWAVAITGICTAAIYHGPGATPLRLALFLAMGWTAVLCLGRIARKLGQQGTMLLVGGGCFYTAGVPWFVRNRHTLGFPDHAIWHVWVVLGSLTHYMCVYLYVMELPVDMLDCESPLLAADSEMAPLSSDDKAVAIDSSSDSEAA